MYVYIYVYISIYLSIYLSLSLNKNIYIYIYIILEADGLHGRAGPWTLGAGLGLGLTGFLGAGQPSWLGGYSLWR